MSSVRIAEYVRKHGSRDDDGPVGRGIKPISPIGLPIHLPTIIVENKSVLRLRDGRKKSGHNRTIHPNIILNTFSQ